MRHRFVSRTLVVIATGALALSGVSGWAQGRGRGTAPAAPGTPPEVTAIRAGRLFDAKTGTILTNQVVIVTGDRITDVGPSASIPAGARVIDLSTATVLPGMIDMHVHLVGQGSLPMSTLIALQTAQRGLNAGFTTMADMNSRVSYLTVDLRNAINRGIVKGPRLQVAGPAIDPRAGGPVQAPSEISAESFTNDLGVYSADDARRAVRKLKAYGVDFVKIYATQDFVGDEFRVFKPDGTMVNSPSLTAAEIAAAVDEAHRLGLKVACHAYGGEGLTSCIAAGVDIPMHGPEMTDAQLQMIVQKRLMLGITIDDLINLDPGDKKITGGKVSRFTLTEGVFKRAHAAGVPLPFGSGRGSAGEGIMSVGGEASQFSWMTKWGMTPAEALQTAFMVAADSLNYKWGSQIGSVEKGKYADIIAVSGNPLTDVTEMERVKFVMKGGEVIRSDIGRPAASLSTGR